MSNFKICDLKTIQAELNQHQLTRKQFMAVLDETGVFDLKFKAIYRLITTEQIEHISKIIEPYQLKIFSIETFDAVITLNCK